MKETVKKRLYITPYIQQIKLDNEISLALESNPPVGPGETGSLSPDFMYNEPFKNNMG
ncbi:MAG: hypothetical protein GZ091_06890 [Paludibacter sp.]|nr:hypothetical protein [Paludibacter sp.]